MGKLLIYLVSSWARMSPVHAANKSCMLLILVTNTDRASQAEAHHVRGIAAEINTLKYRDILSMLDLGIHSMINR